MNPSQALQLLSNALQPQAVGTITRAGYIQIEQALSIQQHRNERADALEKEVAELRANLVPTMSSTGMPCKPRGEDA